MIIKQIKLSNQSKDRLSRLKGKTGIKNWNVLCRWALCYSLGENTMPTDIPMASDSNVEMSWYTFAGEYDDKTIYKWLRTFYWRFFAQQFKRSCLPDGPKVGSVAVSPRGDLRMPSDASAALWMKELEQIRI